MRLAQQLVGLFWSAAAAAAGPAPTGSPRPAAASSTDAAPAAPALGSGPAICAGGGGAIPGGGHVADTVVGPTDNTIAGTTTIPAGFVISGSTKGYLADKYALAQFGKPYVFAAAAPNAFDCSGLTMAAWAAAGVALPHLASAQTANGTAANPGHVGMIAGYVQAKDGRRTTDDGRRR